MSSVDIRPLTLELLADGVAFFDHEARETEKVVMIRKALSPSGAARGR